VRQIILDTETTGLETAQGHRVIELAGVELMNRRLTGNHFHRYLNPERKIDDAAKQVHGIDDEDLLDKPKFRDIAREFLDYVSGAELIIHNASFDVAFLNQELSLAGLAPVTEYCAQVTDTLVMARDLHPGKRNNLDALCERYEVNNSRRTLHGALLDAELLGEVYLAMTRGQESLVMDLALPRARGEARCPWVAFGALVIVRASEEELLQHAQVLARIDKESKGACLWSKLEAAHA
jgi:DNA polymerase III subunit epsilon